MHDMWLWTNMRHSCLPVHRSRNTRTWCTRLIERYFLPGKEHPLWPYSVPILCGLQLNKFSAQQRRKRCCRMRHLWCAKAEAFCSWRWGIFSCWLQDPSLKDFTFREKVRWKHTGFAAKLLPNEPVSYDFAQLLGILGKCRRKGADVEDQSSKASKSTFWK